MAFVDSNVFFRRGAVGFFFAAALTASQAAAADFPTIATPVTTPPAGASDSFIRTVGLSDGFVVAWNRAQSNEFAVVVQRFKADGKPVGQPANVDKRDPGEFAIEGRPEVVNLGGDKIGVVWKGSGPTLKGAVFDAKTGTVGAEISYLGGNTAASLIHDLVLMKNGRVALVTRSFATGGEDTTLFILDQNMKQVGSFRIVEDDVSGPFGAGSFEQTVVAHGSGGVVIYRAVDYQLMARPFDSSGVLGAPFKINSTPMPYLDFYGFGRFTVKAEALPNGGYVVTWPTYDAGQQNFFNVFARVYDDKGKPVGKDFIVHRDVSGEQREPEIAVLAKGFAIGWHNYQRVGAYSTQRMRHFDLEGKAMSDDVVTEYLGPDGASGLSIVSEDSEYAPLPNGDVLRLFTANNRIYGDRIPGPKTGSGKNDKLEGKAGSETLLALNGKDVVTGKDGDDMIDGGESDDVIDAGPGNDHIVPAGGDDTITGGPGADVFVFRPKGGKDAILDFETVDRIDVSAFHYNSHAAVVASAQQVGKDVVITLVDQTDPARASAVLKLKKYKLENFTAANVIP